MTLIKIRFVTRTDFPMRFLFFLGPAAIVTAGGCVTVNSPLFPGPPPAVVIDRACPALMPSPQAQPPPPGAGPKYPPGTPPATEDAGPMLEVLPAPALPAFVVPRLTPPAPGGARGRTRMAMEGGGR
jgi:hypothetical protein